MFKYLRTTISYAVDYCNKVTNTFDRTSTHRSYKNALKKINKYKSRIDNEHYFRITMLETTEREVNDAEA